MKKILHISIILLLQVFSANAYSENTVPAKPLETVKLQLKWFHQFQFAGYYAAKQQGYYAAEGLDVEILELSPDKSVIQEVVSGEVDYGIGDSGILARYSNGEPVIALAAIFQHDPLVFISKQSSGIISPYEMTGKRVMFDPETGDNAPLVSMLTNAGITPQDYTFVPATFNIDDLLFDKVDVMSAYLTDQPFYFQQKKIPLNIINPHNYGIDFYGDLLFTRQAELKQHPGRAERFRRATLLGWKYALSNPEAIIQLIRNHYHSRLSLEHLRYEAVQTRKLILPDIMPIGQIEPIRLRGIADIYFQLKLSKQLSDQALKAFVYTSTEKLNLSQAERIWLNRHPVITLGIDRAFAPYEWLDEQGRYVGLIADYMHLIEERLGIRFKIITDKSWHEILESAKRSELDMIAGAVKTPERSAYLNFTSPYVSNSAIIINDINQGYIGTLTNLNGKRVAIEQGYFIQELLRNHYPAIKLLPTATVREALQRVVEGKADAYIGDAASATYAFKTAGFMNLQFSGQTDYRSEHRIAVVKSNPELASIMEKTLASISTNERDMIFSHWMGLKIESGIPVQAIVKIGLAVLALFLLFTYWLFRLRKAEKSRQESETRLQTILDYSPLGIWMVGVDGRYRFVNKTFCDATGISEQEFLTTPNLALLLGEEIAVSCHESDQACLAQNKPYICYETLPLVDGKLHFMEITKTGLHETGENNADIITGIIGIAIDITERKLAEQRERAHQEVLSLLAKDTPLTTILESVVRAVEQENRDFLCSILLPDTIGKHLLVGASPSLPEFYNQFVHGIEIGDGVGSCGTAAYLKQRIIVEDIQTHPYWAPYKSLAAQAGLGACWSEPILTNTGKLLGTFAIYHHQPHIPTDKDIQLIEHATHLTRIAIERHQTQESLQLASLVFKHTGEAMIVTDARNNIIAINPAATKITGYAIEELLGKNPGVLKSDKHSKSFYQNMWLSIDTFGHWQGEIWNKRKNGEEYLEWLTINTIFGEDGAIRQYVALFSDVSEKKKADEKIWRQANFDSLTQLPNRDMFADRLKQEMKAAYRDNQLLAVLFLDLDRFKEINDSFGHDQGDLLLIETARRITACLREEDTVARLSGDEFTVILANLKDHFSIERIAQNILNELNKPFNLKNGLGYVSASIGIAYYPDDANDTYDLIKHADQAMYYAKNAGRNCISYFTKSMQELTQQRHNLLRDLRGALAKQQFELYYQPIVDLSTDAIYKAEALIRWNHPLRGMVSPAEFIPLAEESGLINEIGDWVFKQAVQQLKCWQKHYRDDFQISINKSPVQFRTTKNHQDWLDYLNQVEVLGKSIIIEITESLLMDTEDKIIKQLLQFRDVGIQVAIDDFGTGYSALAYIKKFHIDYLKIDKSFTCNLMQGSSDMILCEAIIAMAHKLELKVIAEGVETEAQSELLKTAGCDYGQGYLYSKPLPTQAFEAFLSKHIDEAGV